MRSVAVVALVVLIVLTLVPVQAVTETAQAETGLNHQDPIADRESQPQPTGKIETSNSVKLNTANTVAGVNSTKCATQSYAGDEFWFWRIPQGARDAIAMRFTTCNNDPEVLTTVNFFVWDPGDGSFGNDPIIVELYADDGGGLPGGPLLFSTILPASSYPASPIITTVDMSSSSLVMTGDFWVAFTMGEGGPGDGESFLSDEGTMGVGRSAVRQLGFWVPGSGGVTDYNFLISVELCRECPKSAGPASPPTPQVLMNGSLREDVSGPQPGPVNWRSLYIKRVWFKKNGDRLGKGDVTVKGTVGINNQINNNYGFTLPQSAGTNYKIKRSKKCKDANCGDNGAKCHWKSIDNWIFTESPIPDITNPGQVSVNVTFTDHDRNPGPFILAVGAAIATIVACVALFTLAGPLTWAVVGPCAAAATSVLVLFAALPSVPYDKNPKIIGQGYEILPWSQGDGCVSKTLKDEDGVINGRIEYEWTDGVIKKGLNSMEGNHWQAPLDTRTTFDEIYEYYYCQLNGAEAKFIANVGYASLNDPTVSSSLRDPEPTDYPTDWTREFRFALDADNNPFSGDQTWALCGADYYVSILQSFDGTDFDVDTSIYCWTTDCCSVNGPEWIEVTPAVPYHLFIGNFRVELLVPLSAIGNPGGAMSSWAVLLKDDIVISTAPEDVCSERLQITTQLDGVCPTVRSSVYLESDGEYRISFSEPMTAIVPSNIQLTPSGPFSVSMDVTGRELYITGVPKFAPGYYQVELLAGAVKDAAGNQLEGEINGGCGTPFLGEFCVNDNYFYATDAGGSAKRDFEENDLVYVSGQNFAPSAQFNLYLVLPEDVEQQGTKLIDQSVDGMNLVTAVAGNLNASNIGMAVRAGEYNVVADLNGNGIYESTDRVAGACSPAAFVGFYCNDGIDDIIAWWPLDEAANAGGAAAEVMEGNHGTHFGSPGAASGIVSGALDLDGISDYVEVADNDVLDVDASGANGYDWDFSFEAWIQTSKATGLQIIVEKISGSLGYSFYIDNDKLAFKMGDGSVSSWVSPSSSVADGAWHHVGVSVDRDDPNGLKFYTDGGLTDMFDPTARSGSLVNANDLRIGAHSTSVTDLYMGKFDELTIYERALTPAEIHFIWANGPLGKCFPDSLSTCYASGDVNGDLVGLSVSDLAYLEAFIFQGGPAPPLLWEADLNGDCVVDTADLNMYRCYFVYGISCIPGYPVQTCCDPMAEPISYVTGDANGDSVVNITDAVYLIQYIFAGGPEPVPLVSGDANCDGTVNITDAVYLINYIFGGGPPPGDPDDNGVPDC